MSTRQRDRRKDKNTIKRGEAGRQEEGSRAKEKTEGQKWQQEKEEDTEQRTQKKQNKASSEG